MKKVKVAIIGSGNIGTDLMIKIMRGSQVLEMGALVGVDPQSDGLARAARLGVATTAKGVEGLRAMPEYKDIEIVFDATSAKAHLAHAPIFTADRKKIVDLTPAAVGPFVVPCVNLKQHARADNVNMVTCGGQATIPIVAAVARVATVPYAEIVASVASKSAGPGTRANIDEFTETTARGVVEVGGSGKGKAIIVLNPAEPPLIMRDTVFCMAQSGDDSAITKSILNMITEVQGYVPGYRLKQDIQYDPISAAEAAEHFGVKNAGPCLKVSVFLEVEGAGHYLPKYAGNLDIMTSAALATGELMARQNQEIAA